MCHKDQKPQPLCGGTLQPRWGSEEVTTVKTFTDIDKATSERNKQANPKQGPSDPKWLCQPGLGERNTTLWMVPGNSVGQAPPWHHQQSGPPIKEPPPRTAAGKEGGQVPAGPDPPQTFQSPLKVAGQAQRCAARKGQEPYLGGQESWVSVPAQPPPPGLTLSKSLPSAFRILRGK